MKRSSFAWIAFSLLSVVSVAAGFIGDVFRVVRDATCYVVEQFAAAMPEVIRSSVTDLLQRVDLVRAKAFAMQMTQRDWPSVSKRWRMCPSI